MGIEPTLSAWEAEVLPLNYTRWVMLYEVRLTQAGENGRDATAKARRLQESMAGSLLLARTRFGTRLDRNPQCFRIGGLFQPTRFFAASGPSLFGIGGIAEFRDARRSTLAN